MDFNVRLMDRYINICKDLKGPNIYLQIYTKLSKSCKSGSFCPLIQPNLQAGVCISLVFLFLLFACLRVVTVVAV